MIAIETLGLFLLASFFVTLAPGPDNLYVMTQSAINGKLAGLVITLGVCCGLAVHTTAVAFGLAAVFQASALAFTLLKIVGVFYLLYLAWQAFRAAGTPAGKQDTQQQKLVRLFFRGMLINVTNPKVAIFFLAFLPQFIDPQSGSLISQSFVLGALFTATAFVVFSLITLGGSLLGQWLKHSQHARKTLNRIAGTTFVGLAMKLAVSEK